MFSSLASLLPSALHINTNTDLPKQTVNPEETNREDQENAYDVQTIQTQTIPDQDPAKGKEKDAKSPSEVCRLFFWLIQPEREYEHYDRVYEVRFPSVLHLSSFDTSVIGNVYVCIDPLPLCL